MAPEALEQLILIAYRFIPFLSEEEDTSGFSVVTRLDEVQRQRDHLIGLLAKIGTPASVAALERLAGHPALRQLRDHILSQVKDCVQQSAQAQPMTPGEALGWCDNYAIMLKPGPDPQQRFTGLPSQATNSDESVSPASRPNPVLDNRGAIITQQIIVQGNATFGTTTLPAELSCSPEPRLPSSTLPPEPPGRPKDAVEPLDD